MNLIKTGYGIQISDVERPPEPKTEFVEMMKEIFNLYAKNDIKWFV